MNRWYVQYQYLILTDLAIIFSKLVTPDGKISIPHLYDDVAPVTEEEEAIYRALEFDISDIHDAIQSKSTISDDKKAALMARLIIFPSLSLHGIQGAFSGPGAKTVIPSKVIGKFSIRTVPDQKPERVLEQVQSYISSEFKKLNSKNTIHVECLSAGKSWVSDINHHNYRAAAKAVETVFHVKPDYTREGGSIPVTLTFQDALQRNVLLLPMGKSDDGAHSINEKIDRKNYISGIRLFAAYLHEISNAKD